MYIYLLLVDFYGKCRYIYHTWILWDRVKNELLFIDMFLTKTACHIAIGELIGCWVVVGLCLFVFL